MFFWLSASWKESLIRRISGSFSLWLCRFFLVVNQWTNVCPGLLCSTVMYVSHMHWLLVILSLRLRASVIPLLWKPGWRQGSIYSFVFSLFVVTPWPTRPWLSMRQIVFLRSRTTKQWHFIIVKLPCCIHRFHLCISSAVLLFHHSISFIRKQCVNRRQRCDPG